MVSSVLLSKLCFKLLVLIGDISSFQAPLHLFLHPLESFFSKSTPAFNWHLSFQIHASICSTIREAGSPDSHRSCKFQGGTRIQTHMLFAPYVEKQEPHVSGVCYTRIHMLKHPIPTGAVSFKELCLHKDSNLARLPYDRWGLINKTTS